MSTGKRIAVAAALATVFVGVAAGLSWTGVVPGGRALRFLAWSPEQLGEWDRANHARARLADFAAAPVPADAVVFLGSTDVERFPLATAFPGATTANRGVAGDTLRDVLARLDASLAGGPAAGFVVYAGGDDLRAGRPVATTRDDLARVLDALRERAPGAPIAIVGLFGDAVDAPSVLEDVRTWEIAAKRLAVQRGVAFVSLIRDGLSDRVGRAEPGAGTPGGGLTDDAYARIADAIRRDGGPTGALLAAPR